MLHGKKVLIGFALIFLIFLNGCTVGNNYPEISLNVPETNKDKKDKQKGEEPALNIALASITSARESLYYYNDLLEYLEEEIGMPVRIIQRKTYAEVNELIKNGTVDIGFICTYSYVLGNDDFGMELLAAPVREGKKEYFSYIIKRKEVEVESFLDLEGYSFAFTDPISNSGRLYPLYLLKKEGRTPDSFFSRHIYTYSHDNSIRAVVEGLVDAAAVDSLVYDHLYDRDPAYFEDIDILHVSDSFGIQPAVVHPDLNPELKTKLQNFLLSLYETARGQDILYNLGLDKFDYQADSAYDSIREIAEVVKYGKNN